ncbi:hypothetical protein GF325_15280 [Candidatus Bathyarchaeota archaeon]|nr:hypothetical protein [Candidatus Bathyarchaeota archaeon]
MITQALILSKFDQRDGPGLYISIPRLDHEDKGIIEFISKCMDLMHQEGYFLNMSGDIITANYYFEITNQGVRGKRDMGLLTLMFHVVGGEGQVKSEIAEFSRLQEAYLRDLVMKIKRDVIITRNGLFSERSKPRLKRLLALHFRIISINNFPLFAKPTGSLADFWIMSTSSIEPMPVFLAMRDRVCSSGTVTLKTQVMRTFLLQVKAHVYNCHGMLDGNGDEGGPCQACMQVHEMVKGMIYLFNAGDINAKHEILETCTHLSTMEIPTLKPMLLLGIINGNDHVDSTDLVHGTQSIMQHLRKLRKYFSLLHVEHVDLEDIDTMVKVIKFLINLVL